MNYALSLTYQSKYYAEELEIETVSGYVRLAIPGEMSGAVDIGSLSGGIEIEESLGGFVLEQGIGGRTACRGEGQPALSITTVSGEVALSRL